MNFSVFLLLASLKYFASCEKCSETSRETFNKSFNLTDFCENCVILNNIHWVGFCIGNEFFLFENWKCRDDDDLLKCFDSLAMVTSESCEIARENYDLNEDCLKKFNDEICHGPSHRERHDNDKQHDKRVRRSIEMKDVTLGETYKPVLFQRRWTSMTKTRTKKPTTTTSTEETSEETTATRETSTTTSLKKTTATTITETETETTASGTTETETETTASATKETETETTASATKETETETTASATKEAETETTASATKEAETETTASATKETETETTASATKETETEVTASATKEAETETTASATKEAETETTASATKETETETTEMTFLTTDNDFTLVSIENSSSLITKNPSECKNICEPNEFFYKDHCYFVMRLEGVYNGFEELTEQREKMSLNMTSINRRCQSRHPNALGLAVETNEENNAVFKFLKTLRFYSNYTIFTSGFREKGDNEWIGWGMKINQSVVNLVENIHSDLGFYCIDACKHYWYLLNATSVTSISNFYVVCERPSNPKNIQPQLHELCLKLYRKSSCYNLEKHSKYCCEKDDTGVIYFACPDETSVKRYHNRIECSWACSPSGFFHHDRPTCKGSLSCYGSYNQITYIAPVTRYAVSNCTENQWGHSTWYCRSNKFFLGTPDFSLCCNTKLSCRDTDAYLNAWMGCPLRTTVKKIICPPGSVLKEALAEWYCQENGNFKEDTPDYSKCNLAKIRCIQKDRYGREWEGAIGAVSVKDCPSSFTGKCFWKCKKSGVFDGPEPDCSKCRAKWMEEIENKIKNHSNHEEVMKIMENYTKTEDLRLGYGHVLNLTSGCVALFKNQTSDSKLSTFDNFLKSYSKILKNVAGNPKVWSSFSESNREGFSDQVLQTTQNAAFAKLSSKNISGQKYNTTLADFRTDGFDFFVAYNLSVGSQFPLDKVSEKYWHLNVKEIKKSGYSSAAMGLVMNYTLSSLMFSNGRDNLKVNAPALTFKVATYKDGEVVVQPDVIVSISFKHINKTRLPATRVIRRRLHKGEEPSGVFNSTLCYYYRNSTWTTEGCYVTFTSKERTNCTCNHLSTIGLLMAIHEYKPDTTLEVVSTTSSAITIVSLFLALLVFYFFETVKNDRVLIGQNLCFCLLIGHVMLITVMDKKFFNIPDNFCTVFGILLHYVFMAAFAWMLVEGCHLYRMLVLVFDSDVDYRWKYLLFGYGAPFIVVGATQLTGFVLQEQPYGQDELCWLKPPKYVWAFMGPVLVTTLVNFCILVTAMKLAISSKRRTEKSNFGTLKLWIKGWISLSSLLGITWLFGFFYIYQNELFTYTFVVFNGLQGFFIFLFRCVLSEHYQSIFCKKIKHRFFNFRSKDRKRSENIKSETKLYAISGSKSLSGEIETRDSGYEAGLEDKKNTNLKSRRGTSKEKSSSVDVNINVILKPEISEAYLRNKMIARNFSVRKSKTTWLADDIHELSFHDIYKPN